MSLFSDKFFKSNETTFPLSDTIALPSHQNIGWTQHRADALIGLVAMAWGSSYLLMKVGLGTIPPFSLIALRFLIAFFVVSLLFREKTKQTTPRTLLRGSILGLFLFGLFAFLIHGMQTTSTSNAGFLTSTTVVLVPVFHALITRRLPNRPIVIGTLLTMTGIGFMTLQQSMTLHSGDVFCLIGAVVYAFHILLTADFTKKEDGLLLGIWQLGFAGLYGLICTMLFETPTLPGCSVPVDGGSRPCPDLQRIWIRFRRRWHRNTPPRSTPDFSSPWNRCFPHCSLFFSCRKHSPQRDISERL